MQVLIHTSGISAVHTVHRVGLPQSFELNSVLWRAPHFAIFFSAAVNQESRTATKEQWLEQIFIIPDP